MTADWLAGRLRSLLVRCSRWKSGRPCWHQWGLERWLSSGVMLWWVEQPNSHLWRDKGIHRDHSSSWCTCINSPKPLMFSVEKQTAQSVFANNFSSGANRHLQVRLWPFPVILSSNWLAQSDSASTRGLAWLNTVMRGCRLVYACFYGFILQHTGLYPIVSKGMRLIAQGRDPLEGQRHMCGMGNMFHYHSTGFPELDELMRTPQPLIFIMELLQVSSSGKKLFGILESKNKKGSQNYVAVIVFNTRLSQNTASVNIGWQKKKSITFSSNPLEELWHSYTPCFWICWQKWQKKIPTQPETFSFGIIYYPDQALLSAGGPAAVGLD